MIFQSFDKNDVVENKIVCWFPIEKETQIRYVAYNMWLCYFYSIKVAKLKSDRTESVADRIHKAL